jgi:Zn-finger nucleic acid-binding protein
VRPSQFVEQQPSQYLDQQPMDAIQWNEPETGILAHRYPMLDVEIQTGAKLTVRESEMAVFVDQGKIADIFGPGVHTLTAANLPLLAQLKHWEKGFGLPFQSDVYFFSTDVANDQRWGTSTPIMLSDTGSGAIRLCGYGAYSYRIVDPRSFFMRVSGTRESYFGYDLDDRLRDTIVACLTYATSASGLSSLDLIANPAALCGTLAEQVRAVFAALGLELVTLAIESISTAEQRPGLRDDAMDCACCAAAMRSEGGILKCDYCHAVVVGEASGVGLGLGLGLGPNECEGCACPVCAIPLMQAAIGGASLLYCTRCDGMLVAMEELDSLIAASRAVTDGPIPVQAANAVDRQQAIACPQCGRSMEACAYGGPGNVAIDGCENCGLHWLDHGELACLAYAPVLKFEVESNVARAYFDPSRPASSSEFNLTA